MEAILLNHGLPSGRYFEAEVSGLQPPPGFTNNERPPYVDYSEALLYCLNNQPPTWDPFNPPTLIGKRMFYWGRRFLNYRLRQPRQFGLYLALWTALDYYHGVDLFFWAAGNRPRTPCSFTIDLTVDGHKDLKETVDLLLTRPDVSWGRMRDFGLVVGSYFRGRRIPSARGLRLRSGLI